MCCVCWEATTEHLAVSGLTVRLPVWPWQQVCVKRVRKWGVRATWIFIMTSPVYWLQRGGHTQVRLFGPPESTVNWPGRRREEGGSEHIAHIRVIQALTTGVCEAGTKMRGASNMNIHYDVTGLLTAAWRSHSGQIVWAAWINCELAREEEGGGGFWTHSTYTGYPGSAGGRQLDRWRCYWGMQLLKSF